MFAGKVENTEIGSNGLGLRFGVGRTRSIQLPPSVRGFVDCGIIQKPVLSLVKQSNVAKTINMIFEPPRVA